MLGDFKINKIAKMHEYIYLLMEQKDGGFINFGSKQDSLSVKIYNHCTTFITILI